MTRSRVRYDRMVALLVATSVTLFAFLCGIGTFGPVSAAGGADSVSRQLTVRPAVATRPSARSAAPTPTPTAHQSTPASPATTAPTTAPTPAPRAADDPDGSARPVAVPTGSGTGRRIVFDMSAQRVWLVDAGDRVERTYLVSGSVTDNLRPGRYRVYSRSLHAVGVDDSGTMQYFVRFTRGQNAAIGFHDIPVDQGRLVQATAQLGTPQSHGCIRQYRPDAIRLWNFAPVGTPVSVVA